MYDENTNYEAMPGYKGDAKESLDPYQETIANEWGSSMRGMPEFNAEEFENPEKNEDDIPIPFEAQNPDNPVANEVIEQINLTQGGETMNFDAVIDDVRQNSGGNLADQIYGAERAVDRMTERDLSPESISPLANNAEHKADGRQLAENAVLAAANAAVVANGKLEQGDLSGAKEAAIEAEYLAENAITGANRLNAANSQDLALGSSDPLQRQINSASTGILQNLEEVTSRVAELEDQENGENPTANTANTAS